MRLAIGGFLHESHSLRPAPTTYADFVHPAASRPCSAAPELLDAVRGTSVPARRCDRGGRGGGRDGGAARLERSPIPPGRCRTRRSSGSPR